MQYGKNKEDDRLPKLNLALVFGETSNLPFYYRKLAGNIPDSKTLKHLLAELDTLEFAKMKLVMDRGFYSEENINALFKDHLKFLIAGKMSLNFIRSNLEGIYDNFRSFEHYNKIFALLTNEAMDAVTCWKSTETRTWWRRPLATRKNG